MVNQKKFSVKAVVLEKKNRLIIKNIDFEKLKRGQVLVKIIYSGICRSQLMEINGKRGEDKWLPHCLGHEASGEVVKIGPGVKKVKRNDKVILTWIKSSGYNAVPAKYLFQKSTINSGQITTFSNYTIVSENRVVKKPKNISMEEAVLFGCAIPTGFGMVINQIKPNNSESILIIGIGGVGLSALLALKCLGITDITVLDNSRKKLNLAKKFGVSKTIYSQDKKTTKKILTSNLKKYDICIECAGLIETIELGFSLINDVKGRLYFASHPQDNKKISISPHELIKGKKIIGSWGGETDPDKDIKIMANMIKKSKIDISKLIKKKYKIEDINKAIFDLDSGNVYRPIIKMKH